MRAATLERSIAALVLCAPLWADAQTPQQHVHEHGAHVMSFDIERTLHVFQMTEDGGIQQVVAREDAPQPELVARIQHHLAMEAGAFQKGDFTDPARLHGRAMPGLEDLQANAGRIVITYAPLPNGGEIRFRTSDLHLVTAIHRWFGAQLSEHGADAQAR